MTPTAKSTGESQRMSLTYEEDTHRLRGCFFDVQNGVGLGKQERGYQEGCELWLKANNVPFVAGAPHHIRLRDKIVHTLRPDLVAWDRMTVKLKAEPRSLQNSDFVRKLIISELDTRGLKYAHAPVAKSFYHDVLVDESPLDCMLVESRIVLTFTALLDDNEINIGRGRSYMQALGIEWGVAANFGKKATQFAGLHVAL